MIVDDICINYILWVNTQDGATVTCTDWLEIYILNRYGIIFFYTFLLCFYIIDTPHTTSDKDYSSFGRKQKHK